MARKKKQPAPQGAPEWMVTFGDMMALLLTFFVMLVSMSEIREDEKFQKVMQSLSQAFGYNNSMGTAPTDEPPENSLIARLDEITLQNFKMKTGNATDEGVEGRENTVKRIREGIEFTIGGGIGFETGSAELKPAAKEALVEVSQYIRGENNKIEVRGHTTKAEVGPDRSFESEHDLAYARASAVARFLTAQKVRADRLRRVSCGSSEPLILRAYDERTKAANRRVEIIVNQSLVQQFEGGEGEAPPPDAPAPPPGGEQAAVVPVG